jgi:hypothetical protein
MNKLHVIFYIMARTRTQPPPATASLYMKCLHEGGVTCWWCSERCEGPCVPMPTRAEPPWGLVGFFCCVGCAKAYMVHRRLPVSYLKLYVRTYAGIPFSCPLPCSPPWQTLEKYGPPAGVLTYSQFRQAAWAPLPDLLDQHHATTAPTRMARHDMEELQELPRKSRHNERRPVRPKKSKTVANTHSIQNSSLDNVDVEVGSGPRLSRRGPKPTGGILSFFTHN